MALSQFSFLDTQLYGDDAGSSHGGPAQPNVSGGTSPQPRQAVPYAPTASQPIPDASRSAKPQPSDAAPVDNLLAALETVQLRIASSEKRLALLEQRILGALDDCQSRQPPPQKGCTWGVFIVTVLAFLTVTLYTMRAARSLPATPYPLVLPAAGPLPASPSLLLGAPSMAKAVPPTFLPQMAMG